MRTGVVIRVRMGVAAALFASLLLTGILIPATGSAAKPPLNLMVIGVENTVAQDYPQEHAGAAAAVMAINKAGGINGQQINLTYCQDQFNANVAATCADEAVSQKDVAVIGESVFSSAMIPILQAANIPYIGGDQPYDGDSPDSYPFSASLADEFFNFPAVLAKLGAKKIALLTSNLAAVLVDAKELSDGIGHYKLTQVADAQAPNSSTDYSPYAETVKDSGATGVAMILQAAQIPPYFQAASQLGVLGPEYVDIALHYPPAEIAALEPLLNSVKLTLVTPLPPPTELSIIRRSSSSLPKWRPPSRRASGAGTSWTPMVRIRGFPCTSSRLWQRASRALSRDHRSLPR